MKNKFERDSKESMVLIYIFIVVLGSLIIHFLIHEGTPWGSLAAKKQINDYLSNKYAGEVVIDWMVYDFNQSTYSAIVHAKKNPTKRFEVTISEKGIVDCIPNN